MTSVEKLRAPSASLVLRIRFRQGERPHRFWVSAWSSGAPDCRRYKVLSKRLESGALEALAIEERGDHSRRGLRRIVVPRATPSGWLDLWARRLADELQIELRCFDLSHLKTASEWTRTAATLGWRISADD